MANALAIKGLRETQRAFRAAGAALEADLKDALEEAAAPVRSDAQALASSQISNVKPGDPWAGMRIGSGKSIVWIAPAARSTDVTRRRPKFGTKLLDDAMEPALERNEDVVVKRLAKTLEEVAQLWGRV